ncbi:chromosome partitioning protein, ParB family [Aliiroseovarius sediminilitoris]|uniref:Chromosome partitioning protein, ParB family n=1 Tax=Aliiroseovarius sediminilitoris TaxID=1173584 RepID=A0A1I0RAR4_9RHOB|nr:ParB N-terminal domain-containing protein [Aliiroseovarius sediminilitoris]SEW37922.1 chromosome partitioning protein, ParB family [Aliiroseovarius sediminilitoris]
MSKRRVFDIDFPETDTPAAAPPAEPVVEHRRGPMASAISENAAALEERKAVEASIRAENDRLAHEHVRLKKAGLITDLIPLTAIRADKLTRDRKPGRDEDLDELKASIRDVGLSNPIRIEQVGEGVYELVQGFRRLTAFQELYDETGDDAFARIPAGLIAHGEELELLYRRMVDENLVRRDISFAEMAELARGYVADPETSAQDSDEALTALFGSLSRQKRSYIKHFMVLLDAIGSHLKFPEAIPRALGLSLEKRLVSEPGLAAKVRSALAAAFVSTPDAELAVLREHATPAPLPKKPATAKPVGAAKTTFRQDVKGGTVRCAASEGRIEMRIARDFSNVDRHRLEDAVKAFFQELDG